MKKLFLTFLILAMCLLSACRAVDEEREIAPPTPPPLTGEEPPAPGLAAPMVFVNDRIYILNPHVRDGRTILDDSFIFIGEIQSINAHYRGMLIEPENFQSNGSVPVGSRLYQSEDNLVAVFADGIDGFISGYHLPMRYIGVGD